MEFDEKAVSKVGEARASSTSKLSDSSVIQQKLQCPGHTTEKKLMAKIDFRLIPALGLCYFLAFLDRVNISNALTLGLPQELQLKGEEANIALAIFFVPYILFEIPSNWLLKRFQPHVWLSACVTLFGVLMLAQGFVKSYSGLLATRFFLGLAEAGIFPGCFYLISFYYKRSEAQRRFTWFWNATGIASAFGSLIASGIARIDHSRGLSSWRWIFIIEGAITIFCGALTYFLIVDFPATAKWLREDERDFILARIDMENVDNQDVTLRGVGNFFRDPKRFLGGVIYFAVLVPLYSLSYFAPTILKGLGLGAVETQLHTVPIWIVAIAFSVLVSHLSDRVQLRSPFLLLVILISICGVAILQTVHHHFPTQYAALFLTVMGTYTAGPLAVCWATMNLQGHVERSIGTAWIIGFGNIGGIIATFTLPAKDAPYYRSGYAICQGGACLGIIVALTYLFLLMAANRKAGSTNRGKTLYML